MKNFLSESSVQSSIIKFLKSEGWFVAKIIMANLNGLPDVMAIKEGRTIFVEVKSGRYKIAEDGLRPLQVARINQLRQAGVDVFVTNNLQDFKLLI